MCETTVPTSCLMLDICNCKTFYVTNIISLEIYNQFRPIAVVQGFATKESTRCLQH